MVVTMRRLIVGGLAVLLAGSAAWMLWPQTPWPAIIMALLVLAALLMLNLQHPPAVTGRARTEPTSIESLPESRQRELLRGTSLFLRERRYRYSVRYDQLDRPHRQPFSAEVNTIALGFIPAIITEMSSERQGEGFVAFVHDGQRFRGPGLPCPGSREEALRHARRCVSPVDEEES